jgi:hypothetical protein
MIFPEEVLEIDQESVDLDVEDVLLEEEEVLPEEEEVLVEEEESDGLDLNELDNIEDLYDIAYDEVEQLYSPTYQDFIVDLKVLLEKYNLTEAALQSASNLLD